MQLEQKGKEKKTYLHLAVQAVWDCASGTDLTTLSQLFGIDKWTVSQCVWDCKKNVE